MADSNLTLRIVSTGEVVTVARWRARRMIESGRAVPIGGGDAANDLHGVSLEALVQASLAKRPSLRGLATLATDGGIPVHELTVDVDAGARSSVDPEPDAERIADAIIKAENAALVTGDGVGKPRGILSFPAAPDASRKAGQAGFVSTGADGEFNPVAPADCLVDLVYALDARYRANAAFMMNARVAAEICKMKDAEGRFLWGYDLAADRSSADRAAANRAIGPFGFPVLICEAMPDIDFGSFSVAFGDFRAAYSVAGDSGWQISRVTGAAESGALVRATCRIGGEVTNADAFRLLQF